MAMSPHPSVKPGKPRKPPAVAPTIGKSGEDAHYGAAHKLHTGNDYGSQHAIHTHAPHKSERAHDFAKAGDQHEIE